MSGNFGVSRVVRKYVAGAVNVASHTTKTASKALKVALPVPKAAVRAVTVAQKIGGNVSRLPSSIATTGLRTAVSAAQETTKQISGGGIFSNFKLFGKDSIAVRFLEWCDDFIEKRKILGFPYRLGKNTAKKMGIGLLGAMAIGFLIWLFVMILLLILVIYLLLLIFAPDKADKLKSKLTFWKRRSSGSNGGSWR